MNGSRPGRVSGVSLALATLLGVSGLSGTSARAGEFPAEWFWGEPEQRAKQDELVGKPMPELKVDGWLNGKAVTAEDMKGKIVVVDFWATWCGPCLAAIPHNNELAKKHAADGVIVVGVCGSESGQERMEKVAKEKGIEYPVAKDSANVAAPAWRVMWWPTYGVVDRSGKLRALGLQSNRVADVVEAILKEQPAEKAKEGEKPAAKAK